MDLLQFHKSQYGVMNHFIIKLYEAFVRTGINCRLLKGPNYFEQLSEDPPDLTVCFLGVLPGTTHEYLCDQMKIPHVVCLVDPPTDYARFLTAEYSITACDDRSCCALLHKAGLHRNFFLPHAVERELAPDPTLERIYDVVFLATLEADFEERREMWPRIFPALVDRALNGAIEITFSDPYLSFLDAFDVCLIMEYSKHPIDLSYVDFGLARRELELYVKTKERVDLVNAISESIPVHIFGETRADKGWKQRLKSSSNIIWHGPVDYTDAARIMKQSKIVLNTMIKNKSGAHERVFAALASGALVLTTDSLYLRETFVDRESILFYRANELEGVADLLKDYLADEAKRTEVASCGHEVVKKYHTWDHRARMLLEGIEPFMNNSR